MSKVFSKFVTSYPKMLFISFLVALSFSILNLNNFKLDASSDSLVLESDDDLKYYREVNSDYASSDFLIVIFKPKEDLFSGETISQVREMVNVFDTAIIFVLLLIALNSLAIVVILFIILCILITKFIIS